MNIKTNQSITTSSFLISYNIWKLVWILKNNQSIGQVSVAGSSTINKLPHKLLWHGTKSMNEEEIRVMMLAGYNYQYSWPRPGLREDEDHRVVVMTNAKFKYCILSLKLWQWSCALRVIGSSLWKVDVADLSSMLTTLPQRLSFIKPLSQSFLSFIIVHTQCLMKKCTL
jgi:hypothetical protein